MQVRSAEVESLVAEVNEAMDGARPGEEVVVRRHPAGLEYLAYLDYRRAVRHFPPSTSRLRFRSDRGQLLCWKVVTRRS